MTGKAAKEPAIDPKMIKAIDDFLADGQRDNGYRAFAMMRHMWPQLRELALTSKQVGWSCAARKQALPEPGECDWPVCGCDPYADKVIAALEEAGHFPDEPQEAPHKALLEEILKIAEIEEIPDRHGKWHSACSTTCLNEIATVVSSALSRPNRAAEGES